MKPNKKGENHENRNGQRDRYQSVPRRNARPEYQRGAAKRHPGWKDLPGRNRYQTGMASFR